MRCFLRMSALLAAFFPIACGESPTEIEANSAAHFAKKGGKGSSFDVCLSERGGKNCTLRLITNPARFAKATAGLAGQLIDFNELVVSPSNTIEGRETFSGGTYANVGVIFSNPNGYPLYIAPGDLFWNPTNSLSVGRFPYDPLCVPGPTDPCEAPYHEDDDLDVLFDPPCTAAGLTVLDGGIGSTGEFVAFLDADGGEIARTNVPSLFFGLVSLDRPIARVSIEERADEGDDVTYDDFQCLGR